ncbi:hypothetical protein C0J52_00811 [Blattella germanica]|nr:hypothetical protein C0J52_00811 [Blattella germanica]
MLSNVETKKTLRTALPQILATSAKNILLLGYGMTLGFPTIVIPSLQGGSNSTDVRDKDTLTLTEEQISWFSSINLICVPLGCLVLTYVAEITQPHLRGMLSATSSMCVILGVFIQFLMGTMMTWRTVAAVNVTFPLAAVVALCFVPESPYWLVATYAYYHPRISTDIAYDWLPMSFLIGSAFLSHTGIRLLPWILIGEVYPSEVRGVASGASGSIGYIFGFAANKSLTLPGTFWFYGIVSLIGTVVFYFFLPETEGRTLHEIQQHFAGNRNLMKEGKVRSNTNNAVVTEKWAAVNPALVPDAESHL